LALVALFAAFAAIQLASYSLNSGAAAPGTLPTRVPVAFGLSVYRALDRVAPAPYVVATLAAHDLAAGDSFAALREAIRLPASPARDELLARIAAARGDRQLALEYFLAAPDVSAVDAAAQAAAVRSPAAGYALETLLERRLALLTTHPDDVAETYFRLGQLANRQAFREIPDSKAQGAWLFRAMHDFRSAVELAPLSDKYLIVAANQAMLLGDLDGAQRYFGRAADSNPGSADAVAGLGVIAYQRGDLATAQNDLRRARALDPNALMVRSLERFLKQ
jgi:tetratricopeptide (TPR) repeat protein